MLSCKYLGSVFENNGASLTEIEKIISGKRKNIEIVNSIIWN